MTKMIAKKLLSLTLTFDTYHSTSVFEGAKESEIIYQLVRVFVISVSRHQNNN